MMRIVLLLFTYFFSVQASLADGMKVILGYDESYAPFIYKTKDESPAGAYIDSILPAIKKMTNFHFEFKPMTWKRLEETTKSDSAMIGIGFYNRPQMRPWITKYSKPIFFEEVGLFCRSSVITNHPIKKYPQDLKGLKVGMVRGYATGGDEFQKEAVEKKFELKEYTRNLDLMKDLLIKNIDCTINAKVVFETDKAISLQRLASMGSPTELNNRIDDKIDMTYLISSESVHLVIGDAALKKHPEIGKFIEEFDKLK